MLQTCPCCNKQYNTVLERKTDKHIQEEYPDVPAWQREQLISGICSNKCWDKFLGLDRNIEYES